MKRWGELKHKWVFVLLSLFLAGGCAAEKPAGNINIVELEFPTELTVTRRAQWGWVPITQRIAEHTVTRITIHVDVTAIPEQAEP